VFGLCHLAVPYLFHFCYGTTRHKQQQHMSRCLNIACQSVRLMQELVQKLPSQDDVSHALSCHILVPLLDNKIIYALKALCRRGYVGAVLFTWAWLSAWPRERGTDARWIGNSRPHHRLSSSPHFETGQNSFDIFCCRQS